jgi:undecaprenyl diphosphate synthase
MILLDSERLPAHVAIIMDGNGRWAKKRGLKRFKGHENGTAAVRNIVRASRELGIKYLTLYAFSEENWKRSKIEIMALMTLLTRFLNSELEEMQKTGIRLNSIGRIEKLPLDVRTTLLDSIKQTSSNNKLILTLALSYGGRQELVDAIKKIAAHVEDGKLKNSDVSNELVSKYLYTAGMPDPDLLIRTGGEYRVSNFLLWQMAYTEMFITRTLWPDFREEDFKIAIKEFQSRERRFGGTD